MANEITYSGSLSFLKAGKQSSMSGSGKATMAGVHYVKKTQTIGATEEAIDKGDIGTIGWAMVKNNDATNFLEVGVTTGVYNIKVLKGECEGPFRVDGTTLFAKADTAPVDIEYLLIEA